MENSDWTVEARLEREFRQELTSGILPFWMDRMVDHTHGGFYGRITGKGHCVPSAEKGAVLNARILWTFSAAFRILGEERYGMMANRAYEYLVEHLLDSEFGGVYWSVNTDGSPLQTKKQVYALGFAIYGLSEYVRATGNQEALLHAQALFYTLETRAYDSVHGGYYEAFQRDWTPIEDMRLSEKDTNDCKTMNTHLHVLESYTNLYRVWPSAELGKAIRRLLGIFGRYICNPEDGHLDLFFGEDWTRHGTMVSYGHDIEASWLMHEAALVLDDKLLLQDVESLVLRIADAATEGLQPDGSIIYESERVDGVRDEERHWWPQAEVVVGYYNIFQHFSLKKAFDRAVSAWDYIQTNLIDYEGGEWFWSIRPDGTPNCEDDKAGFWKCPYHNGRMCLELIERIQGRRTL